MVYAVDPARIYIGGEIAAAWDLIEDAVRSTLPGSEITVHIEPIEEKAAWEDSALVPLEQAARRAQAEHERGTMNEER